MTTFPSSHCAGVLATILRACTGPSVAISFASMEFTILCRPNPFTSSNLLETTTTLKCVSAFLGLLEQFTAVRVSSREIELWQEKAGNNTS